MLEVMHYSKHYGHAQACSDISFTLPSATVTVLLGLNGAGKSTLIKGIAGLLRFEGQVLVNGKENHLPQSRRAMGYFPEIPSFYPSLTVYEHMEFVSRAYRMPDDPQRIRQLLERFALWEERNKLGASLSKGMAQKLNLCVGLYTRPQVLLLDEPFIGLDPHAIVELKHVIEEERSAGATLLVSTHIIDSVDMLWDMAMILHHGKLCARLTRDDLARSGMTLEETFFALTEEKTSQGGM